jgi:uncharacterized protein
MKSRVYFVPVDNADSLSVISVKLNRLLEKSRLLDFIRKDYRVAVKIHFGEEGNTGFVRPEYVRIVSDGISKKGATAVLADTNTLYKGRRTNSADHLAIAHEHGFTDESVGAKVIIPDDSQQENTIDIEINRKFIKTAKVVRLFIDADAVIGINHFKGHMMTGFGGALKNLGMGCATRTGKLQQHSDIAPVVYEQKCTGCGECEKACPVDAIRIENHKSIINGLKCIGCATCIGVCPFSAIDVSWESGGGKIQEKMIEYASAVMKGRQERMGFLNFCIKITQECDCLAKDDPRVAPDIGILASTDPVSIDKASLDLVKNACGKDIFRELHPHRDGNQQLQYARELGLGNLDYDLTEL